MPIRLEDLSIFELSLVDEPANKDARVTIFKRRDDPPRKETTMTQTVTKSFVELAEDIRKSRECSRTEALTLARQRYPEAFTAYQQEGIAIEKRARARPEPMHLARAM